MRINIPIKLERYKEHIKDCSYKISYASTFSLIKIASSKKENTYKELYIGFNPYNSDISLNINSFSREKDIYKIYPTFVKVHSGEISAFMIFSTSESALSLDESTMLYHQKQEINLFIKKISQKNNIMEEKIIVEDHDLDINSTLLLDDINLEVLENIADLEQDYTQHLNKSNFMAQANESTKKEENIKVALKKIISSKKNYKFSILIKNINGNIDYDLDNIKINFYDKESKKTVELNRKIVLKRNSQKEIFFSMQRDVFDSFNLQDLEIKVVF